MPSELPQAGELRRLPVTRSAAWVPWADRLLEASAFGQAHEPEELFDRIERAASRWAGDEEPAEEWVRAGMRELLQSTLEVDMSPFGRMVSWVEMARRMGNTVRLRTLLRQCPEIEAQPLEAPIVIVGLPRSATTFLHTTLGGHPALRAPEMWELRCSALPPSTWRRTAGIGAGAAAASLAGISMPAMRTIHPLRARRPEECVMAMPHSLYYLVSAPLARYHGWWRRHDARQDYRYLRHHLRFLVWSARSRPYARSRRFVLKSPFHLLRTRELLDAFPGARFVWVHRDPVEAVPSWCSLVAQVHRMHLREVDAYRVARDWTSIWAGAYEDAAAAGLDGASLMHVDFRDLVDDPAKVTSQVLAWAGLDPVPVWSGRRPDIAARSIGRSGRRRQHAYTLGQFGLSAEELRSRFPGELAGREA
jgi:hypothetical protein